MPTPKFILSALLLPMLAAPLGAQDAPPDAVLDLVSPPSVNIGDIAIVKVAGTSNVQGVQFEVTPPPKNPLNIARGTDPDGVPFVAFVCGADKPDGGVFYVVAAGTLNGKVIQKTVAVTFAKPPPTPPTPVPPGPSPPPAPPTPVASHLWIITIDDAATRTQQTAATLSDPAFWPKLGAAGHKFRQFDASNPAAAPFIKLVPATVSGPVVLFIDADKNKFLEADALPADAVGLEKLVVKLTGSKIGGDE